LSCVKNLGRFLAVVVAVPLLGPDATQVGEVPDQALPRCRRGELTQSDPRRHRLFNEGRWPPDECRDAAINTEPGALCQ
jgi:hypothetical protein